MKIRNKKLETKTWCDFWRFSVVRSEGGKKLPNFYRKECVAKDVEGWLNFLLSIWFIAIFEDDCHFFYIFLLTITILATNINSLKKHWKRDFRNPSRFVRGLKICPENNRVIRRVRQTQHQNREFSPTKGEIKKKPAKKYIGNQAGVKLRKPSILVVNWVSSCLSFFLSSSTAATYIFTVLICKTIIISLEPCALNAESQHFVLSCRISHWDLIKCPCFADTTERGDWGERRPKHRVKTQLLYK